MLICCGRDVSDIISMILQFHGAVKEFPSQFLSIIHPLWSTDYTEMSGYYWRFYILPGGQERRLRSDTIFAWSAVEFLSRCAQCWELPTHVIEARRCLTSCCSYLEPGGLRQLNRNSGVSSNTRSEQDQSRFPADSGAIQQLVPSLVQSHVPVASTLFPDS